MVTVQQWLDEAKSKGIRKAFIFFHYPVFARSGLGPIPERDNPHKIIAQYGKDMEVIVFNGHVHTTEIYEADGVKYLMLGGGGAEQDPILPGHSRIKVAADYPPDLYWKGAPREEEYNYTLVDVQPGKETKFTLNVSCAPSISAAAITGDQISISSDLQTTGLVLCLGYLPAQRTGGGLLFPPRV